MIKWVDSYSDPTVSWHRIKDIESPENMICLSAGWIEKETKDNITIVPHVSGINFKKSKRYGSGIMTIPIVSILERIKLNG